MTLQELEAQLEEAEKKMKDVELSEEMERILREYKGADQVISFTDYQKIMGKEKTGGIVKSRIPFLDKLIEEFSEGDLIVITAPTGNGKTTLAQTLTRNFSRDGVPSLWFSYEVPERNLIEKFGDTLPEGYLPKVLTDKSLVWIERKIVESIAKFGTRIVFIDHLHYLMPMGMRNPSLEIGQIVRELKLLCKKYNIAIFLIAHLAKTKFDEVITLDDIRDSSFIAQEADFVLTLQRVPRDSDLPAYTKQKSARIAEGIEFTDFSRLSVAKNRKTGRLGNHQVQMVNGFFEEPTANGEDV